MSQKTPTSTINRDKFSKNDAHQNPLFHPFFLMAPSSAHASVLLRPSDCFVYEMSTNTLLERETFAGQVRSMIEQQKSKGCQGNAIQLYHLNTLFIPNRFKRSYRPNHVLYFERKYPFIHYVTTNDAKDDDGGGSGFLARRPNTNRYISRSPPRNSEPTTTRLY
jgi:hypothetical protein